MKTKKGFTLVELLVVISIIALLLAVLVPSLAKAREIAKRMVCGTQVKQIGVGMSGYAMEYNDKMPWYGGQTGGVPDDSKDESTIHPWLIYRTHNSGNDLQYQDSSQKCACGGGGGSSPGTTHGKPRPMRIACLFEAKLIPDGKVFYCPSNRAENRRYDTYTRSDYGNAWGTPHQKYNAEKNLLPNDWIRSGYDYYPIDRSIVYGPGAGMTKMSDVFVPKVTCKKFSRLSPSSPYLSDVIWSKNDVVHRSGIKAGSAGSVVLKNPSINCLFADGHVRSVPDMAVTTPTNKTQRLFDNDIWDKWRQPGSDEPADDNIRAQYLMYHIYRMIK